MLQAFLHNPLSPNTEIAPLKNGFDFGRIRKGEICENPTLLRIEESDTSYDIGYLIYFENDGGFSDSDFYVRYASELGGGTPDLDVDTNNDWVKLGKATISPFVSGSYQLKPMSEILASGNFLFIPLSRVSTFYLWVAMKAGNNTGNTSSILMKVIEVYSNE